MKTKRRSIAMILIAMLLFSTSGYAYAAEKIIEKPERQGSITKIDGKHELQTPKANESKNAGLEKFAKKVADKSKQSHRSTKAESSYVAQNGNKKYTSLQSAIDAANDGDTITILADIDDEAVVINPGSDVELTLDFNRFGIAAETEDVIKIRSGNVTILDADIINADEDLSTELNTGVFVRDADATLQNCYVTTFGDDSTGYYVGDYANVTMTDCEFVDVNLMEDIGAYPLNITGFVSNDYANLTMNNCSAYILDGEGVLAYGVTNINDSYIRATDDGSFAIFVVDHGDVTINDGYYYADLALWIGGINAHATIKKGEFVSMDKYNSAIDTFDYSFGKNIKIPSGSMSSPEDWESKGADKIDVYKRYAAPKTAKANLKNYNGITVSWSKVSGAKAYKVYYKKSTSKSFSLLTTTNKTSITKTGLSSGAKYEFRVYPCDSLDKTVVTKYCRCKYYKSASAYTLKKLSTPKVSKKSKSSVQVKWSNISGEAGYQISKSTSKTGTNIVSTYKTTSGSSKVVKATKGKTYYYKVRAYALDSNGNKVYGPWSSAKAYKLK